MGNKGFYNEFESLPVEAKKEVISYIGFLKNKYEINNKKPVERKPSTKRKFVGIWKNRKDMTDSVSWVKDLRSKEWKEIG